MGQRYVPFTIDDFDFDQWGLLCHARQHRHVQAWYRALRLWCGYTGPQCMCKRQMEELIDDWLEQHPSWRSDPGDAARVWVMLGRW